MSLAGHYLISLSYQLGRLRTCGSGLLISWQTPHLNSTGPQQLELQHGVAIGFITLPFHYELTPVSQPVNSSPMKLMMSHWPVLALPSNSRRLDTHPSQASPKSDTAGCGVRLPLESQLDTELPSYTTVGSVTCRAGILLLSQPQLLPPQITNRLLTTTSIESTV